MVISFVKKYNRLFLSVSCRVGDLSLSFSCRVGEYFFCLSVFVCELTFGHLSVGELSHNEKFGEQGNKRIYFKGILFATV